MGFAHKLHNTIKQQKAVAVDSVYRSSHSRTWRCKLAENFYLLHVFAYIAI